MGLLHSWPGISTSAKCSGIIRIPHLIDPFCAQSCNPMKPIKPLLSIGVTGLAALMLYCAPDRRAESPSAGNPSAAEESRARELSEASRVDPHPVYSYYLMRFSTKIGELEKKVVALRQLPAEVNKARSAELMKGISELDSLVQRARADLNALREEGPSSKWETTRDRTDRAIVSAERAFDSLAIHFGVVEVKQQ